MYKKLIFLAALSLLGACTGQQADNDAEFGIEGKIWMVTGFYAPKGYQEMHRLSFDTLPEDPYNGLIPGELTFDGSKLRIVFPSGAYRTVGYKEEKGSISFDGSFIYGSYGSPDIVTCKVKKQILLGEEFMDLYDAADPAKPDINKGEWCIMVRSMPESLTAPVMEIDCEYGTTIQGGEMGTEDGAIWATRLIAGGKAFAFDRTHDLATIYWGPEWRTPTRAQAQQLLDVCTPEYVLYNGDPGMTLHNDTAKKDLILPVAEFGTQYGIWLADGSALVYSVSEDKKASAAIDDSPAASQKYFVLPVKK